MLELSKAAVDLLVLVLVDGAGFEGRFGQPMTPSSMCALTRSARQMAYSPPRKNPFVLSIGSSVHMPVYNDQVKKAHV
jgi:hypothetical protein